MEVKIKSLSPIPTQGTEEAAGYDIQSVEYVTLRPFENKRIRTGLYIQMPPGTHGTLIGRSSMGSRSLLVFPAKIDSDYRGEIMVQVINLSEDDRIIMPGDRIAQIEFGKHEKAEFVVADELDPSDRGTGGFGSTGR